MAKKTTTTKDKKAPAKKTTPKKSTKVTSLTKKPVIKTTSKPAAAKNNDAAPAVSNETPKETVREKIGRLRQSVILSLVILIGLAATLMSGASWQMRWFYQTVDSLASDKSTVFAMGSKLIVEMPYVVALIIVLGIALFYHLLLATFLKRSYNRAVANRIVPHRWLYVGVSSALMIEILAMIHGVQDIMVLKLMAGSILVTALLGWVVERDNKAYTPSWRVYVVSLITGFLPWLVIIGILLGTLLYGGVRLPWYAYALDVVTFLGFAGIAINQFLHIKQARGWRNYNRVEWNYVLADSLTKVGFAVVLIVGLMRQVT